MGQGWRCAMHCVYGLLISFGIIAIWTNYVFDTGEYTLDGLLRVLGLAVAIIGTPTMFVLVSQYRYYKKHVMA